jgi:hypothetical protein
VRSDLLRWQWSDYATKHRDRVNLLLHIVAVPAFELASLALLLGLVTWSLRLVGVAALGAVVAFAVQGLGHRRERSQPEPFLGAADASSPSNGSPSRASFSPAAGIAAFEGSEATFHLREVEDLTGRFVRGTLRCCG